MASKVAHHGPVLTRHPKNWAIGQCSRKPFIALGFPGWKERDGIYAANAMPDTLREFGKEAAWRLIRMLWEESWRRATSKESRDVVMTWCFFHA